MDHRVVPISNACRVLMIALADEMTPDGVVCRSRSRLAETLGIDPRRVTERLTEAVDAGILRRVVKGKPGQLATYQAMRREGAHVRTKPTRRRDPDYLSTRARNTAPSEGAHVRTTSGDEPPKSHAHKGAHVRPAISTQPQHSDAAETTGSKGALATESPSTSDSSIPSRSRRRREPPLAAGLSLPSAPSTEAEDVATSDSKVAPGVGGAAVARPPKRVTANVEDDYENARRVLEKLAPLDRDKCMAIAHSSLTDPSNRELITYAADVARSEIEVAS